MPRPELGLARRGECQSTLYPDTVVQFGTELVYRPDLSIYQARRLAGIPDRLMLPPDLIVEVLSSGTMEIDLITKRDDSMRFGIGEYRAVDPADASVRTWSNADDRWREGLERGESLAGASIPGVALDVRPLMELAGAEQHSVDPLPCRGHSFIALSSSRRIAASS